MLTLRQLRGLWDGGVVWSVEEGFVTQWDVVDARQVGAQMNCWDPPAQHRLGPLGAQIEIRYPGMLKPRWVDSVFLYDSPGKAHEATTGADIILACPTYTLSPIPLRVIDLEPTEEMIQHRFPRSKKYRVRWKWQQRPENYKPDPCVYLAGGDIAGHPATMRPIHSLIRYLEGANPRCLSLLEVAISGVVAGITIGAFYEITKRLGVKDRYDD